MTCVLSNVGSFQDINCVKKFIFPNSFEHTNEILPDESMNEGWDATTWADWEDDNHEVQEEEEDEDQPENEQVDGILIPDPETWFQDCIISLSPANDVMVVTFEERAVFLQQKWDPDAKDGTDCKYQIVYKGSLNQEEGECITSVLCIPLASQKRSSQGAPDWTCVVIGFTSGYIRIYTENGSLLLSQLLHEDPVLKLKCRTLDPPRYPGLPEQQEELTILYPTSLVTIDGFSLFQSLRACRNQLARATADGVDAIRPPPLVYKKWGLQHQDAIVDHVSTGLVTPCAFDQLQTASIQRGFNASIKSSPPVSTRYITTGAGPFVGFYYALDGSSQPLLSEVAMAVASKLKSALFSAASGWLGLGGRPKQSEEHGGNPKTKPKVEPPTSLPIRFGLPDLRRHGDSISLSPGLNLAVTTDSFGRITLLDVNKGVSVRMWKGYRDAQCGWIQVREEHLRGKSFHRQSSEPQSQMRVALFLVIYAPRRGILEVWNTQQGPRVAAFNVPKSCRLLSPGYGFMGLNNLVIHDSRFRPSVLQCCLLETSGLIRSIQVPFHLALSDKNSRRAHDLHLMKKLSNLIHHRRSLTESFSDSVMPILQEFKMPIYKQQALDKVLSAKGTPPSELLRVVESLASSIQSSIQDLDYENKCLLHYCHAQGRLLEVYVNIKGLVRERTDQRPALGTEETDQEDLASLLNICPLRLAAYFKSIESYATTKEARVHFDLDVSLEASHFLSCFKVSVTRTARQHPAKSTEEGDVGTPTTDRAETNPDEDGSGEVKPARDDMESEGIPETEEVTDVETRVTIREDVAEEKMIAFGSCLFKPCLQGLVSVDDLVVLLESLHVSPIPLLKLLFQVWLHHEKDVCRDAPLASRQLLSLLQTILDRIHTAASPIKQHHTHDIVTDIHTLLYETRHIGSALLASVVVGRMIDRLPKPEGGDKMEEEGEVMLLDSSSSLDISPGWTQVSEDATFWERLAVKFEDLVWLSRLLHSDISKKTISEMCRNHPQQKSAEMGGLQAPPIDFTPSLCLKKIIEGGRGVFAELVAKWACHHQLSPGYITSASQGHCRVTPAKQAKVDPSVNEEVEGQLNNLSETFHSLCLRLPYSLEHDVLQAHTAWEYVVHWNKNAEVTYYLHQAVEHLRVISNPQVKHGVCSMLWHTFLVKRVSSTAFLMDKVGKAPKDRLCRKDVGLSDIGIGRFLGICSDVLDVLYNLEPESTMTPIIAIEDNWRSIHGPSSLVELAVNQAETNPLVVDVHIQLCTALWAIMSFQLKSIKVLGLFDFRSKAIFFKELSYAFKPSTAEPDPSQINTRHEFLKRVLTSAVESLPPNYSLSGDSESTEEGGFASPHPQPKPDKDHPSQTWPVRVYQLADSLYVDRDALKRHHVCELYRSGYDYLTQEILVTITNQTEMALQLLDILGQRLAQMVVVPGDSFSVERQSRLPASLVSWLKTLAKLPLRCTNPPIQDTAHLAGQAAGLLPEDHSKYSLALQLIEAVGSMT